MWRLQPSRPLRLISSKDFRIRHDGELGLLAKKSSRQRADMYLHRARISQPVFPPNFLKTLPLAVVVAKQVQRCSLPQPAMQLAEKLLALRLGDVRFRSPVANRSKNFQ